MKASKLSNYHLTASIHTIQIYSNGPVFDIQPEVAHCMKISYDTEKDATKTIINPNKLSGRTDTIYSYHEFEITLDTILAGAGIPDYTIKRVDLSLDSADPNHYKDFAKLNRCLISMFATELDMKNVYKTIGLFTQKQLSIAAKNTRYDMENYDKYTESDGKADAKARLELRTKQMPNNDIKKEFTVRWFNKLEKSLTHYEEIQEIYNDSLERLYREEHGSKRVKQPRKYRTVRDFVLAYQDCIFCKRQLVDFLSRFAEINDPEATATYLKNKHHIEYVPMSDLRFAVAEIKRAINNFFK